MQEGNTALFDLNQRHFAEADECFKKLKIDNSINGWINNCQRWLFKSILSQILQENSENIFELNRELNGYFGKYLHEIQIFDVSAVNSIQNSKFNRTTIDELMLNFESLKRNCIPWTPLTSNYNEISKINERMKNLLYSRERLEKYIKIPEYENYQIR